MRALMVLMLIFLVPCFGESDVIFDFTTPFHESTTTPDPVRESTRIWSAVPSYLQGMLEKNQSFDAFYGYCPILKTCTGDAALDEDLLPFYTDCCLPCRCDEDCFARGDCCHNVEVKRQELPNQGEVTADGRRCVRTTVVSSWAPTEAIEEKFMLVQLCPNQTGGGEDFMQTVSHCMNPSETLVDDLTPVTSMETGYSYRNKFCAYCNDAHNELVEWDQNIACNSDKDLSDVLFNRSATKQDIFLALLNDDLCTISWERPSSSNVEKCVLPKDYVSVCPPYTPDVLQELCMNDAYFIPYYGFKKIYRNLYCLACNAVSEDENFENPRTDGRCLAREDLGTVTAYSQFTVLLNQRYFEAQPTGIPSTDQCEPGFRYNELLDTCLEVACPFSEILVVDQCVEVVSLVSGVTFEYLLEFTFHDKGMFFQDVNHILYDAEMLTHDYHEGQSVCMSKIHRITSRNDSLIVKVLVARHITTLTDYRSSFQKFKSQIMEANVVFQDTASYTVVPGEAMLSLRSPENKLFSRYLDSESCGTSIALSERQFCPFVVFRNHTWLANDVIEVDGITFQGQEYILSYAETSDWLVYICEDTYVGRKLETDVPLKGGCVTSGISMCIGNIFLQFGVSSVLLVMKW